MCGCCLDSLNKCTDKIHSVPWIKHTLFFSARLLSFLVVSLGMALVMYCTAVTARDVIPVISEPGTLLNVTLNFLVVVVSFNILFNYVCCTSFSLRIGKAPTNASANGTKLPREELASRSDLRYGAKWATTVEVVVNDNQNYTSVVNGEAATEKDSLVQPPHPSLMAPNCEGLVSPSALQYVPFLSWMLRPSTASKPVSCGCFKCGRGGGEDAKEDSDNPSSDLIDRDVLYEIGRLTAVAQAYTPSERRTRLLDSAHRFCRTCNRLKAPREHHCSICDECVPRMDHHCPWMNNCIDAENNRFFTLFILWLCLGGLLDGAIPGYVFFRQRAFERREERLLRDVYKAPTPEGMAKLAALRAPYGAAGHRLHTVHVSFTVLLAGAIGLCMFLFVYQTVRTAIRNATQVELAIIAYKEHEIYRATQYVYRSPYDMGAFRNIVELFRTSQDPVLRYLLRTDKVSAAMGAVSRRRPLARLRQLLLDTMAMCWLVLLPTIRPTGCDGLHYPLFDDEIRHREEVVVISAGD